MKPTHLIWVLGLAGVVACAEWTNEQPIQGCPDDFDPSTGTCGGDSQPGTGGTTGGGGASGDGACTNPDDAAIYAQLEYTDARGSEESGSGAASAVASDCVFGNFGTPAPNSDGCGPQASAIILCATNPAVECTQEEIDALTNCVLQCLDGWIVDQTGGDSLSAECAQCYGDSVSCSAENCAAAGCTNPNSQSCISCRCEQDCTPGFDRCSGLPPSGDCG